MDGEADLAGDEVMERLNRILRLARLRNDKAAIAILETRIAGMWRRAGWTETELRAAWGDR